MLVAGVRIASSSHALCPNGAFGPVLAKSVCQRDDSRLHDPRPGSRICNFSRLIYSLRLASRLEVTEFQDSSLKTFQTCLILGNLLKQSYLPALWKVLPNLHHRPRYLYIFSIFWQKRRKLGFCVQCELGKLLPCSEGACSHLPLRLFCVCASRISATTSNSGHGI
jgi:hypothetical protein